MRKLIYKDSNYEINCEFRELVKLDGGKPKQYYSFGYTLTDLKTKNECAVSATDVILFLGLHEAGQKYRGDGS